MDMVTVARQQRTQLGMMAQRSSSSKARAGQAAQKRGAELHKAAMARLLQQQQKAASKAASVAVAKREPIPVSLTAGSEIKITNSPQLRAESAADNSSASAGRSEPVAPAVSKHQRKAAHKQARKKTAASKSKRAAGERAVQEPLAR